MNRPTNIADCSTEQLLELAASLRVICKDNQWDDLRRHLDALMEMESKDLLIAGLEMINTTVLCRQTKRLHEQSDRIDANDEKIAAALPKSSPRIDHGPNSKEYKEAFTKRDDRPDPANGSRPPTSHTPPTAANEEKLLSPQAQLLIESMREGYAQATAPYVPPSAIGRAAHTMRHWISCGLDRGLTKIGTLVCILHLPVKRYRLALHRKVHRAAMGTAAPNSPAPPKQPSDLTHAPCPEPSNPSESVK